jgi:hypothetical protein
MRRSCHVLAGTVAIALTGCLPPPMNIGYVNLNAAGRGRVDISGQAGAGAEVAFPLGGGGAVGHVEPFVAERWSIPVGAGLGLAGAGGAPAGYFPLRVGLRHRALPGRLAWGFGLGPSVVFTGSGAEASGVADVELIVGKTTPRIGFSFGIRPAFSFQPGAMTFYGMLEPAIAVPVSRASITFGLLGGPWVTTPSEFFGTASGGFLGASIGVHRRF